MNVASLALGIIGAVLASLSLGWQAANYVLTGGRVKGRAASWRGVAIAE